MILKLLCKTFMWLGDGLFRRHYIIKDADGQPLCIMFTTSDRAANNAMRQWVEALDRGEIWEETESDVV